MADFSIPILGTAVVGFASTVAFSSDFISESFTSENLVCYLDSSIESSYPGTGSIWTDLSGTENNAVLSGNYNYSDYSITFASGGYAIISNNSSFDISGDFAIETFFYMTQTPDIAYPSALVSSWSNTGNANNKFILFVNASGTLALQINGESNSWTHPGTISLNQWHHVVVSRISGVINMYIDGVSGGNISYPSSITPTLDIAIGSYSSTFGVVSFQGKLPLVRIYNGRGLTSSEVYNNSRAITIQQSNGTVSIGNLDFSHFDSTRPGWLTGRRPAQGQVFPRGVYNK